MGELKLLRSSHPAEAAEPPLRSVVQLLRNIADGLEEGLYGLKEAQERFGQDYVCRGALVLRITGQEPQVFGLGDTQVAQTFMDLHAGVDELMSMDGPERCV